MSAYKRKIQAQMAEMAAKPATRVMIAIPSGDSCNSGFAHDLAAMVGFTTYNAPQVELALKMMHGTVLCSLRNDLANEAMLNEDVTHVLWLDSDMRFPMDTLLRLLARNEDIVCASYPTRRAPVLPTTFSDPENIESRLYVEEDATGLLETGGAGMGVMLMRRAVLAKTAKPWFVFAYCEPLDSFQGEDIWFLKQAYKAGFKCWIDQDLTKEVRHAGEYDYSNTEALMVRAAMKELNGAG